MGFIKDVYDNRSEKLVEVMDKTEKAIEEVLADKIYTSNDFRKVKDNFANLAKNLENSEVKDWLQSTKETLMGDSGGKSKSDEDSKLGSVLGRFDKLGPKVAETKQACESLWKAYQYTDELTPHMEWLVEKRVLATRDISSNCASETEELIERQEKVIDQLDKKRKVFQEIIAKGTKLKDTPKCPPFLGFEVKKASDQWKETNDMALDRLDRLKDNLSCWEKYENKRNELFDKLNGADKELADIKKVYNPAAGVEDHKNRVKNAATIRKEIESVLKTVQEANGVVQVLLTEEMKAELNDQVAELEMKADVNKAIDEKLATIDSFNGKLKTFLEQVDKFEKWNAEGRKRMDDLLNPPAPIEAEDRVLQTMELGEDIRKQLENHEEQQKLWDDELGPTQQGEESEECKVLIGRMDTTRQQLDDLNSESETEAAKFGEDVKYLAEVTNSTKKFDPWIKRSEERVKAGLKKAENLEEGHKLLEEVKAWKADSDGMKATLDGGNASAQKMTTHGEADKTYAGNVAKWSQVDAAIKEWITKMEALVKMWEEQAATAEKVTAAISAPANSDMKLEDLEAHLNSLKQMFIEKQKMMDKMNAEA